LWTDLILLTVIGICVVTDLKKRIIYNKVIFPALFAAFGLHAALEGWSGLGQSLMGFTVGLCILLIPYLLGGMGAGDVKLLALVGALKGTWFVLAASFYMALLGALIAIAVVLFQKGLRQRIQFLMYVLLGIRFGLQIQWREHFTSGTYPYGVAIAGGAALCLFQKGWGVG
jgi:prepilin peptidase CpaA